MKIQTAFLCLVALTWVYAASSQEAASLKKGLTITSGSVTVEKASIYNDVSGKGDAVIMIHGGLLTKEMWDSSFEKLARQYRVVRYDARNHGKSRSEEATSLLYPLKQLLGWAQIPDRWPSLACLAFPR
jgi:pimeloyl-ACP methyl ester carboxylesterase